MDRSTNVVAKIGSNAPRAAKKRGQWRVTESEAHLIRSLPVALYRANLEGGFEGSRRLNPDLAKIAGFSAVGFVVNADLWPSRIHPDDLPKVLTTIAATPRGGNFSVEYRWLCADDSERIFQDQGTITKGTGPAEIRGVCLDVTERRRLERRMLWAQRFETMGHYMDDLAHDLMNMLSVTIWNLDGMLRSLESGDPKGRDRNRIEIALKGANSAADMLKRLTACARRNQQRPQFLNLSELIQGMEKLLDLVTGDDIELNISPGSDLWKIFGEQAMNEAVLIALILAVREMMPEGGQLLVTSENVALDRPTGNLSIGNLPRGEYVAVTMDITHGERLRDSISFSAAPRFDTLGHGIGLKLAKEYAQRSGGYIGTEAAAQETGARLRWYVPRSIEAEPVQS